MKPCCAHIDVPWLLDRPVKPGDDSDGIQASEIVRLLHCVDVMVKPELFTPEHFTM
jgi:hypothetical protein